MANVHLKKGWQLPDHAATPEHVFHNRRQFLATMGFTAAGTAGLL